VVSNRGLFLRFGVKCPAESLVQSMRPEDSRGKATMSRTFSRQSSAWRMAVEYKVMSRAR
jgi:hypothetical protein